MDRFKFTITYECELDCESCFQDNRQEATIEELIAEIHNDYKNDPYGFIGEWSLTQYDPPPIIEVQKIEPREKTRVF